MGLSNLTFEDCGCNPNILVYIICLAINAFYNPINKLNLFIYIYLNPIYCIYWHLTFSILSYIFSNDDMNFDIDRIETSILFSLFFFVLNWMTSNFWPSKIMFNTIEFEFYEHWWWLIIESVFTIQFFINYCDKIK